MSALKAATALEEVIRLRVYRRRHATCRRAKFPIDYTLELSNGEVTYWTCLFPSRREGPAVAVERLGDTNLGFASC